MEIMYDQYTESSHAFLCVRVKMEGDEGRQLGHRRDKGRTKSLQKEKERNQKHRYIELKRKFH